MESNKDEAYKCAALGKTAAAAGEGERALRFFTKAAALYPCPEDYYEILGIARDSSGEEVKRAYRKLAVKVHPDKNSAPGAEEAFKMLSKAASCLNDPVKREQYNRFGPDDPRVRAAANGGAQGMPGARGAFDEEFDPQEIFNMFFGVGGPFAGAHHMRFGGRGPGPAAAGRAHPQQQQQARHPLASFVQLLPVLFLVFFTFFGGGGQPEPVYSLQRTSTHTIHMTTARLEAPFYVTSSQVFQRKYPEHSFARRDIDTRIESDYRNVMTQYCQREEWNWRVRGGNRRPGQDRPSADEAPSCAALHQLSMRGTANAPARGNWRPNAAQTSTGRAGSSDDEADSSSAF